ncbi:MAG: TlpA family protein disulfide reductase [Planctomycetota bacterium]
MNCETACLPARAPSCRAGLCIALIGFFASHDVTFAGELPAVPRYAFEVGQEFTYAFENRFEQEDGLILSYRGEWVVWVVGKLPNGNSQLVVKQTSRSSSKYELDVFEDAEVLTFERFEMSTTGEFVMRRDPTTIIHPYFVFPRLPEQLDELWLGWEWHDAVEATTHRYRKLIVPISTTPGVTIEDRIDSVLARANPSSNLLRVHIAADLRLPVRLEVEYRREFGVRGTGDGRTILRSSVLRDPTWIADFRRQAGAYFDAREFYIDRLLEAQRAVSDVERILTRGRETLEAAASQLTHTDLASALAIQLQRSELEFNHMVKQADRRREIVGKPAPEWRATDFDGREHSSASTRGKQVVIGFWQRGSSWCLYAMLALARLKAELSGAAPDAPVLVLGANNDPNEADARHAIAVLAPGFPNVRAQEISAAFSVSSYPTCIVIDAGGIVRLHQPGYSSQLVEQLRAILSRAKQ